MRTRHFVVLLALALTLPALAGAQLGVLYFKVAAPDDSYDYLSEGLAEMLMTDLANQPDITVVERERLDQVLQEHALSGSGITDPEQAVEVGRMLKLDLMIMGTLTLVEESMRLDAQVLGVETGEIIGGVRAETPDTDGVFEMLDQLSAMLVDKIRDMRYGDPNTPVVFVDPAGDAPRVDVAFIVDTTGSMGDEIEVVKQKMREIASEVARGNPAPAVRFAIVEYRDRGDAYVTKISDFTYDVVELHGVINGIYAGGGGDTPESVYRALDDGLNELDWDDDDEITKLVFLIGDAGPHEYDDEYYDIEDAVDDANDLGASIFAIGCSGLDQDYGATEAFKQVAYETNGSFEYLSYRQIYQDAATGEVTSLIYEGGRYYDEEEVRRELEDSGVVDEDTDIFEIGVTRINKAAEATDRGEVDTESEGYGSGGAVGGITSSPSSVSDDTVAAAEERAAGMAYTGGTSGAMVAQENNLDSLITQVIQFNAATQGVSYDMGVAQARVKVRQGDEEYWVPISDPAQVERLREAAENGETLWLAAGVKTVTDEESEETKIAFKSGTLRVYNAGETVPLMTQRTLDELEEDPAYYAANGLGDKNQWSFQAEIVDFEEVER